MSNTCEPPLTVYVSPEVFGSVNLLGNGVAGGALADLGPPAGGDVGGAFLPFISGEGGCIFCMNDATSAGRDGILTAIFAGPGAIFKTLYSPLWISVETACPPCSGTNVTVPDARGLPW